MLRFLLPAILSLAALAKEPVYELDGRLDLHGTASVSIYGVTLPFEDMAPCDTQGRFRFRRLAAGTYTLAIMEPGRGEARVTVEIGPASADSHQHVALDLHLKDSEFAFQDAVKQQNSVSARELAIPARAWREYEEAKKCLGRRDVSSAKNHLEKAVALAPQLSAAWNTLGTIAYQERRFDSAAECFRQALAHAPDSYEPLVNLGGVLINLNKLEEARSFNERAVGTCPNDALANSQLGITYFELSRFDLAEKYLARAVEIDPSHFSHPQLVLAEIHVRQNCPKEAADDLEGFLRLHPDWPQAETLKENIARLRRKL
jgi:tetratricopeptide (TPR) repeat protein